MRGLPQPAASSCNQAQLTRYVRNGLEEPAGGGLRIDVDAVRRDPGRTSVDR